MPVDIEQAIEVILSTTRKQESSIPVDLDRKLNKQAQQKLFGAVLSLLRRGEERNKRYEETVNALAIKQEALTIDELTDIIVNNLPENDWKFNSSNEWSIATGTASI